MSDQFSASLSLEKYPFDKAKTLDAIDKNLYARQWWPLVYLILSKSRKEIYVGETTNASSRMTDHLSNASRRILNELYLLTSDKFNKSATLDIESYLIKYIAGDGQYTLQNGNAGLMNHNYFQRDEYYQVFKRIWVALKEERIAKHDLEKIDNSNLFKYSPYKSLTTEQSAAIQTIVKVLIQNTFSSLIVEGGAGTGKTVLASYLMKLLKTEEADLSTLEEDESKARFIRLIRQLKQVYPNPTIALVVPMTSLRKTLQRVFKNVKGLSSSMVIGPSEVTRNKYDILLVDEAHRLRRRVNITNYRSFDEGNKLLKLGQTGTELDWIKKQSKTCILFYDEGQSIKPSDVRKEDFRKLKQHAKIIPLTSQLRVKGGLDYINYIERLFDNSLDRTPIFKNPEYEFLLFENIEDLQSAIKERERQFGLSRLIAGYAWEWKSKNGHTHDIKIGNTKLKWNTVNEDWINSNTAIDEVGCIHTTQGYDLNYAGVIFGEEIYFDTKANKIAIDKANYHDRNGKSGINDDQELHKYIVNIYKTMMCRAIKGTFIYVCNKELKEYFKKYINYV